MIKKGNTTIAKKSRILTNPLAHATGLMFRKTIVDEGWIFTFAYESYWHITNLFVFQTIDVLWLDKNNRVLQVRTIKPFTLHCPGMKGTKTVIELPGGTAAKKRVSAGDTLSWDDSLLRK